MIKTCGNIFISKIVIDVGPDDWFFFLVLNLQKRIERSLRFIIPCKDQIQICIIINVVINVMIGSQKNGIVLATICKLGFWHGHNRHLARQIFDSRSLGHNCPGPDLTQPQSYWHTQPHTRATYTQTKALRYMHISISDFNQWLTFPTLIPSCRVPGRNGETWWHFCASETGKGILRTVSSNFPPWMRKTWIHNWKIHFKSELKGKIVRVNQ